MLSRPPYGYRLIRKTEACGARLEVDDSEARVVRWIYDLYVRDGLKMHEIGPRLDAQGVRPRHAQHWSCSTVAVILRNEAYIGKAAYLKTMSSGKRTRHNRTGRQKAGAVRRLTSRTARAREEWIELPVPVIVDEAVFARAQQQRAVNRRFSPRKTIEQTLLQGLCVCGHCGYAMGRHSGGSSGTTLRRHYYRCHGIDPWRRPHGAVCDNPVVRADELDEAVWKEVLALLENPELIQCEINRRLAVANDTLAARRRIDTLHSASWHASKPACGVCLMPTRGKLSPSTSSARGRVHYKLDNSPSCQSSRPCRPPNSTVPLDFPLPRRWNDSFSACAKARNRCLLPSANVSCVCSCARCRWERKRSQFAIRFR